MTLPARLPCRTRPLASRPLATAPVAIAIALLILEIRVFHKCDDGLIAFNLLLLLGITWIPFPTALLAEHLRGPDSRVAGVVYVASFFVIAIVFNLMWRYAVRAKLVVEHLNVKAITRQYSLGPIMYGVLVAIATLSGIWCLVFSALYALYFALPPRLWQRGRVSPESRTT